MLPFLASQVITNRILFACVIVAGVVGILAIVVVVVVVVSALSTVVVLNFKYYFDFCLLVPSQSHTEHTHY